MAFKRKKKGSTYKYWSTPVIIVPRMVSLWWYLYLITAMCLIVFIASLIGGEQ